MIILGIETSCDETSAAVLKDGNELLSNVISTSLPQHEGFGGVVPEIASRHSLEHIDLVCREALKQASVSVADINLIAVTEGPGLIGSLFVGVSYAKALSYAENIPMVGVNHLEAHLACNFIGRERPERFLGLLVSGGHTLLALHEKDSVKILGETVDDAVGEAYDKVAKLLGLGFPGGPAIDKLAKEGNPKAVQFTKPKQDGALNFSFSGIKTAVLNTIKDFKTGEMKKDAPKTEDIAASFQHAVIHWIVEKTLLACEQESLKTVVLGGGVSANTHLREKLSSETQKRGIDLIIPPLELTGDNAGMVARRGYELHLMGKTSDIYMTAKPSLTLQGS